MTALLLIVIAFALTTGAAARLNRLVTKDTITEPWRDRAVHLLSYDTEQRKVLADHQEQVEQAMLSGQLPPVAPALAPAENPARAERRALAAYLLQCGWCAGLWTSALCTLAARIALSLPYPPLWNGIPLHPLDLLIVPAVASAVSYGVGRLAAND